jgi:hypothetical protein
MNIIKNDKGEYFAGFVRTPLQLDPDPHKWWEPRFTVDGGVYNNTCALITEAQLEETIRDIKNYVNGELTIIKV